MIRPGEAGRGWAWQQGLGTTRQGWARPDVAAMARHGTEHLGPERIGSIGSARRGRARIVKAWIGKARLD